MAEITIYTSPTCGYCHQVKQLLSSEGIEYKEVDVIDNPEVRDEIVEKTGHMTLPIIMNGEELIGGYDDLAKLHADGKFAEL
jgi:glutaredoxin 3